MKLWGWVAVTCRAKDEERWEHRGDSSRWHELWINKRLTFDVVTGVGDVGDADEVHTAAVTDGWKGGT